ncbi:MAG TPA: hypothetical protein VIM06_07525 [Rhodanobacter sp.]
MGLAPRAEVPPTRRFAAWAIGPWLLLMLAALGCVQYLQHAEFAYLVAALVVVVVCAGCILRQGWARPAMRALAAMLALWALVSAVLMLQHGGDFERARQHALAQPQFGQVMLMLVDRAQRTWQVGLALRAIAIPLLLWLAWVLGRPTVRAQFRQVRSRRV